MGQSVGIATEKTATPTVVASSDCHVHKVNAAISHVKPMQFSIRDIVLATTAVALMLAFARIAFAMFLLVFLFANAFLFIGPFTIIFTTIIFADQRGSYLDLSSNPLYRSLKRLWLLSVGCTVVVWGLLYLGSFFWR